MKEINLYQDKHLVLAVLECNAHQIENKINDTKLLSRGTDHAQLLQVQHLFDYINSNFNVSLNHNGLRKLFYNLCYIDKHSHLRLKNRIRINKLSIKVATLFIKSCSKCAVNKIINIITNHKPNENDLKAILTL